MIAFVSAVLLLAAILLLPVKWAAAFADANDTSWSASAAAAVAGPLVSFLIYRLLNGGFGGFVFAFIAGIATYTLIFRVPGRKVLVFTLVVIALQIAVLFGFYSFGINIGQQVSP